MFEERGKMKYDGQNGLLIGTLDEPEGDIVHPDDA